MRRDTESGKRPQSWKARRARAERLFAAGERQAEIARRLGVSRQCVHNWFRLWKGADTNGSTGNRPAGSGRKPKLSAEQMTEVEAVLRRGPRYSGFECDRWTLWRVADAIKQVTGIRYHPSSVWRLLRSLGWTLRYPRRARKQKAYIAREWSAPGDGKGGAHQPSLAGHAVN
jgi:transposase